MRRTIVVVVLLTAMVVSTGSAAHGAAQWAIPLLLQVGYDWLHRKSVRPLERSTALLDAAINVTAPDGTSVGGRFTVGTAALVVPQGVRFDLTPYISGVPTSVHRYIGFQLSSSDPAVPTLAVYEHIVVFDGKDGEWVIYERTRRGGLELAATIRPGRGETFEYNTATGEVATQVGEGRRRSSQTVVRARRASQTFSMLGENDNRQANWVMPYETDWIGMLPNQAITAVNFQFDALYVNGKQQTGVLGLGRKPFGASNQTVFSLALIRPEILRAAIVNPRYQAHVAPFVSGLAVGIPNLGAPLAVVPHNMQQLMEAQLHLEAVLEHEIERWTVTTPQAPTARPGEQVTAAEVRAREAEERARRAEGELERLRRDTTQPAPTRLGPGPALSSAQAERSAAPARQERTVPREQWREWIAGVLAPHAGYSISPARVTEPTFFKARPGERPFIHFIVDEGDRIRRPPEWFYLLRDGVRYRAPSRGYYLIVENFPVGERIAPLVEAGGEEIRCEEVEIRDGQGVWYPVVVP